MKIMNTWVISGLLLAGCILTGGCGKTVADAAATTDCAFILKDGFAQLYNSTGSVSVDYLYRASDVTVSAIGQIVAIFYLNLNLTLSEEYALSSQPLIIAQVINRTCRPAGYRTIARQLEES